ncbi:unnamed protein product [Polarella glacialis]|uniref:Uncharacterized protein n=1 Tax=Polarella glacialis TaxID=89957 RepID=A0A813LYH4_POLGL|nr:unnamed protein product [Polarella glacialis]
MPGDLTAAVGAMGRFQWWEYRQPSCAFYRKALNTEGAVDALRVLSEPDLANPCIPFLYEVSKKSSGTLPITPARMADVGKDTMQDACAIIGAHSLVASNSLFFKYLALLNENRPRVVLPVPSDSQAVEPFLGQDAWTAEFPEWSKLANQSEKSLNSGEACPWNVTLLSDPALDHFVPSSAERKKLMRPV